MYEFYVNPTRDPTGETAEQVRSLLRGLELPMPLVIALGGDGTILRAAHSAAPRGLPVLGINIGGIGFLSAFSGANAEHGLKQFLAGKFTVEDRMMLDADGKLALNELVIHRGANTRPIQLEVNGLEHIRGDGLIVATPTGSTAYSLSAGGQVVDWERQNILLTPICANIRPSVLPPDKEVTITLQGEVSALLSIDGLEPEHINIGSTIHIKRSEFYAKVVRVTL